MQQKVSFWQSKNRRMIFLVGILIGLIGLGYAVFSVLITSGWKEAKIMIVQAAGPCSSAEQSYKLTYDVAGKRYEMATCSTDTPSVSVVTYNPSNPSNAVLNTAIVNVIEGGIFVFLGLAFVLGAIFTTDPKPGQLGYKASDAPVQLPQDISGQPKL